MKKRGRILNLEDVERKPLERKDLLAELEAMGICGSLARWS
jgi:hypothetical protein